MKTPATSAKRHLINNYHHSKKQSSNFIFFLLLLLVSPRKVFASLFTSNQSLLLAYVNKGSNQQPKPLMSAWRCHGKTQRDMVDKLASAGIVKATINKQALRLVDRKNYVLNTDYAYEDSPQPIGYAATISAPHMHAHVLEDLLPPLLRASKNQPTKPLRILDVGCGSGYLTAVFGRMVEPKGTRSKARLPLPSSSSQLNDGKVYGIDFIPELVEMSRTNILKEDGDLFDSNTVEVAVRDGWKGYPEGSPYNVIHVGAAAATFPKDLMMQLAVGGVMVIPVGPDGGTQYEYKVERVDDSGDVVGLESGGDSRGFVEEDYEVRRVLGVRYVPLVRTD